MPTINTPLGGECDGLPCWPSVPKGSGMSKEIWKDIPGWPYQASSLGRVRRRPGSLKPRSRPDGMLTAAGAANGYLQVTICHEGTKKKALVHRLVLEAFSGPCPGGMECAHKNGNKTDNRLGNLRWTTKLENEADKVSHGTSSRGQGNGNAKLTENSIVKIRSALLSGEMQRCLAKRFGVAQQTISDIKRRIKWNTTAAIRALPVEE